MKRIIVAQILIPSLLAAPPSVEKLLRRPFYGPVRIELNSGVKVDGSLVRVTDRFVAVRHYPGGCEQIPVSDIRQVRDTSPSELGDEIGIVIGSVVLSPVLIPMAVVYVISQRDPLPFNGTWQTDRGSVLELRGNTAERKELSTAKGTWAIQAESLTLDTAAVFTVSFDCESMKLAGPDGTQTLRQRRWPVPAGAPMIGDWYTKALWWTFRTDGSYRVIRTLSDVKGQAVKSGHNVAITWPDGTESTAARHGKSITLTTNGVAEEFVRTTPDSLP